MDSHLRLDDQAVRAMRLVSPERLNRRWSNLPDDHPRPPSPPTPPKAKYMKKYYYQDKQYRHDVL